MTPSYVWQPLSGACYRYLVTSTDKTQSSLPAPKGLHVALVAEEDLFVNADDIAATAADHTATAGARAACHG